MTTTADTGYQHIELREDGTPMVAGTGLKVPILVIEHLYHGADASSLVEAYPSLTLAQAHSVLGYYYDHKDAIDADIARRERDLEEWRKEWEDSPNQRKLRDILAARQR